MLNNFLPDQFVKNIFQITPELLKEKGVKGIITDLDNTLVEWDRPLATPQILEWFEDMKKNNIKVTIVSNNKEGRVKSFSDPLNIPFIFAARKPMGRAFRRALKEMELSKTEAVVIGDQLLTDVLGGNRSGFHTILVVPVAQTDGFATRLNRKIERRILNWFRKKGKLTWED
ncbi:YqeG family HAD IIIA-type phosphatase [Niallia taxi]|uniref:YqeG family HAD IIIA-type phosphatase n=1 Tax=Niallia taxi TaxID=2499688 RepID=A0A3S3SLR2_9BACI|nr:YqeG family HAD IIIA-type phosphatase [Niallia taxi]MCM3215298.1 YqeG family HAD IIIA-type phosphatase [Niallia taxi]MDK8639599.1 YqeG family HAD IIIA-type phosphatase [Niallia taxi]MED4037973.1 YqeG family HAD IIIA-type phosphatase [Niallia taxi]MED4055620.1 YqeG family HAD IIIA-type phosphatase [Niallia taxi]MED4117811.1 YqeG family HAD IIIA-type phosphatase [Niallia taxi]